MKKILLSLHDVTPVFEREIDLICHRLDSLGAIHRSLLVVPDFQRNTPVGKYPRWCGTLVSMRETGTDLSLHGMHHEYAECGFLSESAAITCLGRAKAQFEEAFGFSPFGFVAPQWFQSPGCKKALIRLGFAYSGRWGGLFDAKGNSIHPAFPTNYDWGLSPADAFFAWWNPVRLLNRKSGVIRFSVHPMDVRHKLIDRELGLLSQLMERGWEVLSYADAAKTAAEAPAGMISEKVTD